MPTATPETLVEVVRAILVQAQQHAAGEVEHILDQIEADAEAGWAALKKLVGHQAGLVDATALDPDEDPRPRQAAHHRRYHAAP